MLHGVQGASSDVTRSGSGRVEAIRAATGSIEEFSRQRRFLPRRELVALWSRSATGWSGGGRKGPPGHVAKCSDLS